MEKRNDGTTEVEAGDEMLVVMARHASGTAVVGTFTSYRLADIGATAYSDEYGKNGDGALGPVLETQLYSTCLDQHGTCPLVTRQSRVPSTVKLHDFGPRGAPTSDRCAVIGGASLVSPHPGPYTKELLESGLPDYAVLVGPSRVVESPQVVWDLFDVDASPDMLSLARGYVGLPVSGLEPEADHEVGGQDGDDLDAALSYLRSGGALCKVPDSPGSKHFRLMVVPFPGSPVRGNCV